MNRENGVLPTKVRLAARCHTARGDRPSPGRDDGGEFEMLHINPINRDNGVLQPKVRLAAELR